MLKEKSFPSSSNLTIFIFKILIFYVFLFLSINIQIDLYIDGRKFTATKDNPEILDDWPLHRIKDMVTYHVSFSFFIAQFESIVH